MKGLTVVLAVAVAVTAPTAHGALAPKLRLVTQSPLVVRGDGFRASERVVVTALTLLGPERVIVRASGKGTFRARLELVEQPCGRGLGVRAVGARGSSATLRLASAPCVPPPRD